MNFICDTFELNWSGAKQGSVSFVAIPNGNPPDESKPDRVLVAQDIGDDVSGTYKFDRWPMAEGVNFTVTMSDGTGFGAGGTSDILVTELGDAPYYCGYSGNLAFSFYAEPEKNWDSCQTISLHPINKTSDSAFDYYAISPNSKPEHIERVTDNSAIVDYKFTQPVGSQVIIFATSEEGGVQYSSGGSSQITTLGKGDDTSCVKDLEPSPTDRAAPTNTGGSGSGDLSGGEKAGAAVGSILGAAALIGAIVAFIIFRRKKSAENHEHAQKVKNDHGYNSEFDEGLDGSYTPYVMNPGSHYTSSHHQLPTETQGLTETDVNRNSYSNATIPASPSTGGLLLGSNPKRRSGHQQQESTISKEPRYHTDAEELSVFGLLSALNFASGYRETLHKYTGKGAFDNIKRFVLGLFLSKDSGTLTVDGLEGFTNEFTIELLDIKPFNEKPHPTLPGVVVGERDDVAFEFVNLVTSTLNDIGRTLRQLNKASFGDYLFDLFSQASGADNIVNDVGDNKGTITLLTKDEQLVTRFESFRDEHTVKVGADNVQIKLYKKALILVETISIELRGRSDVPFELPTAELPIFSDNVIPSMLLHWGIIEIPESSSHFDETTKRAFKHDEEEYKAIIDGLEQEQQRDLGAVVQGPSLSSSQAALIRSAAVEAILTEFGDILSSVASACLSSFEGNGLAS
ncbi:hypothetical protein E3Q16_00556 [Wallemia mellicola]|uniref:Queuosine 5'-phosphate N-glycosylase/hydrolase n=1 Tax=Wallemia mellicola TaxID=1708541 RepID=A0AB38MZQ9_9BASI|nr:hypothetical protein E3Q16_00556 [Wallemia mellicola]TIC37620.1 hypothetical protein E3Q09_00658 [Wallemia mellicola]TIC69828.1 hypothetical protein E3Q02_00752 [Wallemia mellicola]